MAGAAKPMQTDREWLWLAGLAGLLLVTVAVGGAVGVTGPVFGDPVEFHVAHSEGSDSVEVSVDRVSGGEPERVRSVVLADVTDEVVFRTTAVGSYEVSIRTEPAREPDCTRVVSVRRTDGTLDATVRAPADGGECPVALYVA